MGAVNIASMPKKVVGFSSSSSPLSGPEAPTQAVKIRGVGKGGGGGRARASVSLDQQTQVRVQQTYNQGLHQLLSGTQVAVSMVAKNCWHRNFITTLLHVNRWGLFSNHPICSKTTGQ